MMQCLSLVRHLWAMTVGNAALVEYSNNQKFALGTKILATVKTDWPL